MPRRRGGGPADAAETIREVDPSAADTLAYVEDLIVRVRGEARALANRIVAGTKSRRIGGSGGGGGGPLDAVDRLDEIRVGLQRVIRQEEIE